MNEERSMNRLFVVLTVCAAGVANAQAPAAPTFARDVAPIFQAKCQVCHQPNSIAPMSLISYDDAKKYAGKIKARVVSRIMPPWHIDKSVGIQSFKNDRSLNDAQIETIAKWVDASAPLGDPKDMPAAVKFPDPNSWQLAEKFGPPDLIVTSKPFTVPAKGEDKWFRPLVETGVHRAALGARHRSAPFLSQWQESGSPRARVPAAG